MGIDELIGNAEVFPILKRWDFFNHAGVSPLPKPTAEAMRRYLLQAEESSYLKTDWFTIGAALRKTAASLIGAHRDEIALVKNTAEGLSTVAHTMHWQADDRIVLADAEYPANVYPWMELARRYGVKLIVVPERDRADGTRAISTDELLAALDHPRAKLLTLSHVQYASGQRMDVETLGLACRKRGVRFCIDAIQSAGALPIDVVKMNVDYLACGGQKWLMGPPGAGFFYCRRELLPMLRPLIIGADNVINAQDYSDIDYTLKADASKLEAGTANFVGHTGLRTSMELLLNAGIENVAARLKMLGDRFVAGAVAKGYRVVSPREKSEWSGMICLVSALREGKEICATLQNQHRTELVARSRRPRFAPHFYNTTEQVDRLIEHLPSH